MAKIVIDLDEPHAFYALSDALNDWSTALRDRANDDGEPNAELFTEWADTADRLLQRIEDTHYGTAEQTAD